MGARERGPLTEAMFYTLMVLARRDVCGTEIAQAVAETTGASVRTFHSCQTVSRAELERGETYISLMMANAGALREGLS